ncbi:hypothetical protein SacglDRAFT_03254 [Saccharomonospora glauca K62]|jgi:hypothetical protein|uniref:Uncharacterized protein n=1 Tax=Saccharomonospora glauca K62 TaxID=928724 RepID=I1D594_9PSEU|nr:hypothetical protein SacglDRAFT_03254 [Saccharomonospora glauca K62]
MRGPWSRGDDRRMSGVRSVKWPVVVGLGAFGLVRPVLNITGVADDLGKPLTPILATVVITLIWIAAVGFTRVPEPVLTLVFAGLTYGVLTIVVSAILSPILDGELQGPLAHPAAIVGVLGVNALWGLIAGLLAAGVRRVRDVPIR